MFFCLKWRDNFNKRLRESFTGRIPLAWGLDGWKNWHSREKLRVFQADGGVWWGKNEGFEEYKETLRLPKNFLICTGHPESILFVSMCLHPFCLHPFYKTTVLSTSTSCAWACFPGSGSQLAQVAFICWVSRVGSGRSQRLSKSAPVSLTLDIRRRPHKQV